MNSVTENKFRDLAPLLFSILFIIFFPVCAHCEEMISEEFRNTSTYTKVQAARSEIRYNTSRARLVATLFAEHFDAIISSSKHFDLVNSQSVIDTIAKSGYGDDAALLRFAESADIAILAAGSVDDTGGRCVIHLYALCYDAPHNGDRVGAYRAVVELGGNSAMTSAIVEEHTAHFLEKLFTEYCHYAAPESIAAGALADGEYDLYGSRGDLVPSGTAYVRGGRVSSSAKGYILRDYKKEAAFLKEYYYGRKKEMVLPPASSEQALYTAVATPLVSVVAPIASPVSYYSVSDYSGLGLWALNNGPWLYVAADGFFRSPANLEKEGQHPSRYNNAANGFMWYYFFSAGASAYADAISYYSMKRASEFNSMLPWTGNEDTAFALSILGSGGGFFYKGERGWGYLYFQADALLFFSSVYCLVPEKGAGGGENERFRRYGYMLAAGALSVRVLEFVHCQYTPFAIRNGQEIEGSYALNPSIGWDGSLFAGLSATVYF